jgi:TatD DNase family protein
MNAPPTTLADTHCHLDFHVFDEDRGAVLDRAREAGVGRILNPGIDLPSSRNAVHLAQAVPEVYAAVGIHPNEALTWQAGTPADLQELVAQSRAGEAAPVVVAIGEIGLDYYRDRAPRQLQHQVFQAQLDLAAELGLPVVIHNREATADLLSILADWQAYLASTGSPLADRPGVLHSFSGDARAASQAIELNFYIGITGPVTFKKASALQEIVAGLPESPLLLETDAPFLAPHPFRGKRNEPAWVRQVAGKIAELRNLTYPELARQTSANAERLFRW